MKPRIYYWLMFSGETEDDAVRYRTKREAIADYAGAAQELARYGQTIDGCIYVARMRDEIVDYPDFTLSLGPRGGVRCEPC